MRLIHKSTATPKNFRLIIEGIRTYIFMPKNPNIKVHDFLELNEVTDSDIDVKTGRGCLIYITDIQDYTGDLVILSFKILETVK